MNYNLSHRYYCLRSKDSLQYGLCLQQDHNCICGYRNEYITYVWLHANWNQSCIVMNEGLKISDGLSTETGYYILEVSKENTSNCKCTRGCEMNY